MKAGSQTTTPDRSTGGRGTGFEIRGYIACAASLAIRRRNHAKKTIGEPYAGKPHVRIERGMGKPGSFAEPTPLDYQCCS